MEPLRWLVSQRKVGSLGDRSQTIGKKDHQWRSTVFHRRHRNQKCWHRVLLSFSVWRSYVTGPYGCLHRVPVRMDSRFQGERFEIRSSTVSSFLDPHRQPTDYLVQKGIIVHTCIAIVLVWHRLLPSLTYTSLEFRTPVLLPFTTTTVRSTSPRTVPGSLVTPRIPSTWVLPP